MIELTGILDMTKTLSGFSNTKVLMIAALFIIGEGLRRTGWTALAGRKFVEWAGQSMPRLLVLVTLGSGVLSGFVSNTGTVAALLPVTVSAVWKAGTPVGRAWHSQKATDGVRSIEKWLEKNPAASPGDRAAAENVIRDMKNALEGR